MGEVTPLPQSPPSTTPLSFSDIAGRRVGMTIDECWSKRTRTGTRSLDGLPQQLHLMLVTSDSKGMSILHVLT
jgi:hypothetical protein